MRTKAKTVSLVAGGTAVLAAGWLLAQTAPTPQAAPSSVGTRPDRAAAAPATQPGEPRPVVLYVQEADGAAVPGRPFINRVPYYGGGFAQGQPVPDAVQQVSCVLQIDTASSSGTARNISATSPK